jgi:hypothetical protein
LIWIGCADAAEALEALEALEAAVGLGSLGAAQPARTTKSTMAREASEADTWPCQPRPNLGPNLGQILGRDNRAYLSALIDTGGGLAHWREDDSAGDQPSPRGH